jgi:imidazolonepropionase-like amidohydrolase
MRLDLVVDIFYVLGSLSGGLTGSQVCFSNSHVATRAALEVASVPEPRVSVVTAFVNVNVVPMDSERVVADQTVLVERGRITALGPADKVPVPAGAVRIEGRGKYLMPGLADMHFHIASLTEADVLGSDSTGGNNRARQKALFSKLAMGVTAIRHLNESLKNRNGLATIRQPEGVSLTPKQLWQHFETAEVPLPRIYLAPGFPKALGADSVAAYVAAVKAAGYHHISSPWLYAGWHAPWFVRDSSRKTRSRAERVVFDSLVAAARRVGLPVSTHSHGLPFDALPALGATGGSTEHVYEYWDSLGFTLGTPDSNAEAPPATVQRLVAATKHAGVWVTPTLRCSEGVYRAPAHIKVLRQIVKALQDAGVGLLLAADDGWTVHDELAALVGAGLTPYQALLTGTRNPAQYLGLLDSAGTVAVGKRADLVLLSGNPLQDVRHAAEPAGVMIGSRWLDRPTLDRHQASLGPALTRRRRTP